MSFEFLNFAKDAIPNVLNAVFPGSKSRQAQPQKQSQVAGQRALSPTQQNQVEGRFQAVGNAFHPDLKSFFEKFGLDPNDPYFSSEWQKLQQANGDNGMHQLGILEEPNQLQKGVAQAYGNPAATLSPQGLAAYLQPFQDQGEFTRQALNNEFDTNSKRIQSQRAAMGSQTNPHTSTGFQRRLDALESDRSKALVGLDDFLRSRNTQNALALQNNFLGQQERIGGNIQNFNQQRLNNASGYGQFTNSPEYGELAGYNELLAPYLSGSMGSNIGPTAANPNRFTRAVGAFQKSANSNFGQQQDPGLPWVSPDNQWRIR